MANAILPHSIVDRITDRWTLVSDGPLTHYVYLDGKPLICCASKHAALNQISLRIQRMQVADAAQDLAEASEDDDARYDEDSAETARSWGHAPNLVTRGDTVRR